MAPGGGGYYTEGAPLVCHAVVAHDHQTALIALKGVLGGEICPTAVT